MNIRILNVFLDEFQWKQLSVTQSPGLEFDGGTSDFFLKLNITQYSYL